MTNKKAIPEKQVIPEKKTTGIDWFFIMVLLVIGLTEAIHLVAVVMDKSLSFCAGLFAVGFCLVVLFVATLAFAFRRGSVVSKRRDNIQMKKETIKAEAGDSLKSAPANTPAILPRLTGVVAGLLMVLQVVAVLVGESVYVEGDMTLETVQSFLATDGIYRVNPLTGAPFGLGMPFRLKILCLPTLYSILCYLLPVNPGFLVYHLVPAFVLVCSYLVYWQVAGLLFGNESEGKFQAAKKHIFMILVVLLFWVGSYAYGMDGFGALYCGYRGVTIRGLILLPYTISLVFRKKWLSVILCVLAEACMVWTLYGMGACLFVAVFLTVTNYFLQKREDKRQVVKNNSGAGKGGMRC